MNSYKHALSFAEKAHRGQKDKGGQEYIEHLIFVSTLVNSEDEKIIALLHDILEDTKITIDDLQKEKFSKKVIEAVDILTKKDNVSYFDYIENVKKNSIAKKVKIADLTHNIDITRIPFPTNQDYKRQEKYKLAIDFINDNKFDSYKQYKLNQ